MRILLGLAVAMISAGCQTSDFSADLSYARGAGLGYRNAGLLDPGTLYVYDQNTATLQQLTQEVRLTKKPATEAPTTLRSSRVEGVVLTGSFPSDLVKGEVAAAIGTKVSFYAENAVRDDYTGVFTALADAYTAGAAAGDDMLGRWRVRDVVRQRGKYYVVVNKFVRADKASISVGGLQNDKVAELSLTVPGFATPIKVSVTQANAVDCSGKASPCFFDVSVIKPYFGPSGKLNFRDGEDVDRARLTEAIAKL